MNPNLGVVMLRTLTVSVLLAIVLSPVSSYSQEIAKTMQVDALWPGGELGLNLTGAGYDKIGMWGRFFSLPDNHQEFGGRLINYADGFHDPHDTQTAGVIISSGEYDLASKGIAYASYLNVYKGITLASKIGIEAAEGMEIVSNSTELSDCYNEFDGRLDEISMINQNFLFFQAAGNAGSYPSGGGKNVVSVGSVIVLDSPYLASGDVVSSGNKVGPSIDGRIKPDLVAPGGPFTACVGTNGYAPDTSPATSYAAPAAAGVGVLLQQYYQNYIDGAPTTPPMQASALKALLIHTAEEAGPAPGPDAEFGWGLINARRAAEYITMDTFNNDVISTYSISNGGAYERQIYSDATEPIKVTIVWTDPPSINFVCDGDDKVNPRLINDVDLLITKGTDTFYPWTLNSSTPVAYATNLNVLGNHLDNVEQVYIESPPEGFYTVYVDHTDGLTNGSQDFSMIISGNTTLKALKQDVLAELQSDYPVENKKVDKDLKKAIEHLEKSLETGLWEDDFYLTDKGKKVFTEEMLAVKKLMDIIKEKNTNAYKAEALKAILKLVDIDETLAQLMVDKAIANNGNSKEIEKSIVEMEKAQKEIGEGNFDKAINNYKIAWEHAYLALKKVGLAKYSTASDMAEAVIVETPASFSLGDNYPNPFNPTTTISFNVPEYSEVSIAVYNLMGEKIRTLVADSRASGNYLVNWNGTDNYGNAVSTGMYFYELKAGDFKQVKRMTFMK